MNRYIIFVDTLRAKWNLLYQVKTYIFKKLDKILYSNTKENICIPFIYIFGSRNIWEILLEIIALKTVINNVLYIDFVYKKY